MLCDYGCGQEAMHQFKNGKWCCSKYYSQCSAYDMGYNRGKKLTYETKQKIALTSAGRKHTEETKKLIGSYHKNKIVSKETREKISNKNKGRKISEETRLLLSSQRKGNKHPLFGKKLSKETKLKISNTLKGKSKRTIEEWQRLYPTFSKEEEMRYNPDKPDEREIQVHCKNHNCPNSKEQGGWFTPTGIQFSERLRHIESRIANGGAYFYCSIQCKNECPLYGKHVSQLIKEDQIKAGIIQEELYNPEDYQTWREEVLKRANNECQYCGQPAEHCHHIQPQKLDPIYVLDPDNGIACCEECHYKYGHKTGTECSTGNLSHRICK